VQCLLDQLLGDERPIGVGGVDEVHPEFDGPAKHPYRLVWILGVTPKPRAGEPHRTEAQTVHREIAAEGDGASRMGR